MMKRIMSLGAVLVVIGMSVSSVVQAEESPTSVVKGTIDEIIRILKDETLQTPDQTDRRRQLLEEIIGQRFDFKEMGKRSLAAHWKNRSESEQREFVKLFQRLLSETYVGKIDDYSGETVQYNHERRRDSFAEVQTTIETNTDKIGLDYRLILKDGKWGVYDVVVDGVSLVRNYRSQFDRIIRRSSYNELVKTMQERKGEIAAP